jgi:hypothetical protein
MEFAELSYQAIAGVMEVFLGVGFFQHLELDVGNQLAEAPLPQEANEH